MHIIFLGTDDDYARAIESKLPVEVHFHPNFEFLGEPDDPDTQHEIIVDVGAVAPSIGELLWMLGR